MIWNRNRRSRAASPALFEELEQRTVLYQTPMATGFVPLNAPTPLESRTDSIVRILTNVGAIDIELFEALAPTITANFRSYITSGKYDESFFHSLGNGVLQGGGYKYDDLTGLSTIAPGAPVPNGFSRSNLAQTLAMVPINGTQLTSQFIINLQDNTALNTQSGGFTVFAKVIQGWSIIQTIAGYTARNLNQQLTGSSTGPFGTVPTTPQYDPNIGPREATLVKIIDIETIKAPGAASYYGTQLSYPEGMRTATSTESIDLVNQDLSNTNYFQIIVHYESGDRDAVIFTGSMQPGARFTLKVNDAAQQNLNLVRTGVGYSIDILATKHLGATFNHTDNGAQLSEAFYMAPLIPVGQFRGYQFGNAVKGPNDVSTLLVENLSGVNSVINVMVFPDGAFPIYTNITLKAFRRGTINLSQIPGLADGDFSVWTTSTEAFTAAVSHYKTGSNEGSTSQGVQGQGRIKGALAGAILTTGGEAHVDVVYTGSTSIVIVDFVITLSGAGGTLIPSPITLTQSQPRASLDLSTVPGLPRDQYFSIQYSERQQVNPVSATYRSNIGGDEVSTAFQIASTTNVTFADGFTDPTIAAGGGMSETISVFNPYTSNAGVTFSYQLLFHFSDGTAIFGGSVLGLNPLARRDHKATDFPNILSKIQSGSQFYHYSVEVVAAVFAFPQIPIGGVVAQLTRNENGIAQSVTTIPSYDPANIQFHGVVYLDNPEFGT
jgi:cyclophilin family peptidyl-prolyl cis-trans isomerase